MHVGVRQTLRKWPLASYCVLAYGLSWIAAIPLVLHGLGRSTWHPPEWYDPLIAFGPGIAAVLVMAGLGGACGAREFIARCFDPRIPASAWILAVASPIAIFALAFIVMRVYTGAWPVLKISDVAHAWWLAPVYAALSGPGEEPGWRGFALTRLLERYPRFRSTVLLTLLWVPWHLPMFIYRGDFGLAGLAAFSMALFFGSIWLTQIQIVAGGMPFAAIAWHTVWNFLASTARAHAPSPFPLMTTCILVGAVIILVHWYRTRERVPKGAPACS